MGNLFNNLSLIVVLLAWTSNVMCLGYHPPYSSLPAGAAAYQEEIEYEYGAQEYYSNYNPYHDRRVVDNKGRYTLEWTVDYDTQMIIFNMTVNTIGWVGIGLSKDGKMKDADIMVGWVGVNGQGYVVDLHADYNRRLVTDTKQSWKLVASSESNGITYLMVTRPLDTCDPYDYPITVDMLWVLWAYGETDELEYHFDKRGSFRAYLLDPVLETHEPHVEAFRIANKVTMKEQVSSNICSIHKGPHLMHKHHMVEFHPYFGNTLSETHAHHIHVWRCVAPPGMIAKQIFEPLLGYPGEECLFTDGADRLIPFQLCRIMVVAWNVGGKPFILPYSTGIPFGESFDEYFMLEQHFNNPELLPLELETGMKIHYTNKLRANDGGTMMVGYDLLGLFLIPPISTSFEVYGFCTQNCTRSIVPDHGFEIIAVALHIHSSGKKTKLKHFRNDTEQEWILKDDNSDSEFQINRVLYEPRLVLPGDLLVVNCEYDNTWTNVTTPSGVSASEETCTAILTITKRVPYYTCRSQIPEQNILSIIGAQSYTWDIETQTRIITAPPKLAGITLSYLTDNLTDWTKSLRYKLQEVQLLTPSVGVCPQILLPTPTNTASAHEHQHHSTHQQQHESTTEIQTQQLQGAIISSSADTTDILTLAKGYGTDTIMGDNMQVPLILPGAVSLAIYPYVDERYEFVRQCPQQAIVPSYSYYSSQSRSASSGGYQPFPYSYYYPNYGKTLF